MEYISSISNWIASVSSWILPFLILLTVLVFVHEMGHYLVARRCGVRIEVFSIGFGPEIRGWNDRHGTRWRFSLIPIGGYVKMFGEQPAASGRDGEGSTLTEAERAESFAAKTLLQRSAIVFAGPLANFLLAIVMLAGMFMAIGQPFTPADISEVMPGSAAERAGLKPGDVFVTINGTRIERFEQVQRIVTLAPGQPLEIKVRRDGREIVLDAVAGIHEVEDRFGNTQKIGRLGVRRSGGDRILVRYDPATAVWRASVETVVLSGRILDFVWQMIIGTRTTKELGGPIRIAQISADMWQLGIASMVMFAVALSVNLGLLNLFPVPMLDGGHLLFYLFEAIRGKPLGERAQEYGFRIGIVMVLGLMVFATWNDLEYFHVVEFFVNLVT
jgi:regulator of sigma E protease